MFSAWWETADMALCLWPRAEAPVQLAELHFSQAVPSCVCLLHLKLIFWVVWQAFPRCPSLQHMWFRWVPWAVPASRPDFWFLTLVRLPLGICRWVQTEGSCSGHLRDISGVWPLCSPSYVFWRQAHTVWFTSLSLEHCFFPFWLIGCAVLPCWGIRQCGSGKFVCLSPDVLVFPPYLWTCPSLSEEWKPPAAVSFSNAWTTETPPTGPALCLLPAFHWSDTEKGRKYYVNCLRPKKSHQHRRDEP